MDAISNESVSRLLPDAAAGGISWWQAAGACFIVFGLLLVFLKILGRIGQDRGDRLASLLEHHSLGRKRDIQVLRCGDEVHYIYRQESSMVLLRTRPHAEWLAENPVQPARAGENMTWKVAFRNASENTLSRLRLRKIF